MARKKLSKKTEKKSSAKKLKASAKVSTSKGMTRRFELVQGKSRKFWEVVQNGSKFTVRFGRIGTNGQTPKTKDAGNPQKATAAIDKLIREKTGRGYKEVTSAGAKAKKKNAGLNHASPIEEIPVSAKMPLTKQYVQSIAATLREDKKYTSNANFSRYDAITIEAAEELAPYFLDLNLSGLKTLSASAMQAFNKFSFEGSESRWHTCELNLSGLSVIDAELASAFASRFRRLPKYAWPASIVLSHKALEGVSPVVAKILTRCKAQITLAGSNATSYLSAGIAEILCKTAIKDSGLSLDWVRSASDKAFKIICRYRGEVFLDSLEALSESGAESLSKHRGRLFLRGLKNVSTEAVVQLSRHKGDLFICVKSLSGRAAEALGNHRGQLALKGLEQISDVAAEHLAKKRGDLLLSDLTGITDRTAECLGQHRGYLDLSGLKRLSAQAAQYLLVHRGELQLEGLKTLSVAVAASLGKHRGGLRLSDECIESLCDESVIKLSENPDLDTQYLSSESRQRIRWGKNAAARESKLALFPSLVEARRLAATSLRSVWEGYGDHGCFDHEFLKDGNPIGVGVDPESDVEAIVEENDLTIEEIMNGSVGVLEIDLSSGHAVFWSASQAVETERFAEFLLCCQWNHVASLNAKITWLSDDEDDSWGVSVDQINTVPRKAAGDLGPRLSSLFYLIESLEGGQDLTQQVRDKCGLETTLAIDVEKRTFDFSGKGKRVSVKVPCTALNVERFQIDLGIDANKLTSKTEKRGK